MAAADPTRVPRSLLEQVQAIIAQAHNIAANASAINKDTRPEAIALAYAMKQSRELASDINRLTELQHIDRKVAGSTLQHLDAAFVT
ncbi:MAG: hypothetical protein ACJ8NR_14180 [Sulfurifustis sp.]